MKIEQLKEHFVTIEKPFEEGEVFVIKEPLTLKKKIQKAVFLGTAFGMYEILLNGAKVDEQFFKPGLTYYHKRVLAQEIDLTPFLKEKNEIMLLLGQGWYAGRYFCENSVQNFGEQVGYSYLIEVVYQDGEIETICSREGQKVFSSQYLYAGIYDGEVIDMTKPEQILGTTVPLKLKEGISIEHTKTKVIKHEEFVPVVVSHKDGREILDFGQNFAGIVCVDLSLLPNGSTLVLRHGEILDSQGDLYTANLRHAKATIQITKGENDTIYEPIFTYMGFRFVELSGVSYQKGLIKAYALYTDMKRLGYFTCQNKDVERIYLNQLWSMRSNFMEIPTDCPQRDERLGYTGDAQVYCKTASYNYDVRDFFENFFSDVRLNQLDTDDHNVAPYVPSKGPHPVGFMTMQGWGSAASIIPEALSQTYLDNSLQDQSYEMLKDYVDLEISKSKNDLWCGISLGDWLSLGKGIAWQAMNNHPVSNAFFVHDLYVLKESAKRLHKEEDYLKYSAQYKKTYEAYLRKFIRKNGKIKKDYQGAYSVALQYVLEKEDKRRPLVAERFLQNVKKQGLATGFFGTANLLPLIADLGDSKLSYDVLLSPSCPGWMYQVKRNATTIWERWDALMENGNVNETKMSGENMVSFNHYSFGAVGRFFYEYILGIKIQKNGIRIQPIVDERLGWVEGSFLSTSGEVKSSWYYKQTEIVFEITVPEKATIVLPNGDVYDVTKGSYSYAIRR